MEKALFVYAWNIDPDKSRTYGPFASRVDAIAWLSSEVDTNYEYGLVEMPFERLQVSDYVIEEAA